MNKKMYFFAIQKGGYAGYVSTQSHLSEKAYEEKIELKLAPALDWQVGTLFKKQGISPGAGSLVTDFSFFFNERHYKYTKLDAIVKNAESSEYLALDRRFLDGGIYECKDIRYGLGCSHFTAVLKGKPYPEHKTAWPTPYAKRIWLIQTANKFKVAAAAIVGKVFRSHSEMTPLEQAEFVTGMTVSGKAADIFLLAKGLGFTAQAARDAAIFHQYFNFEDNYDELRKTAYDVEMLMSYPAGTLTV